MASPELAVASADSIAGMARCEIEQIMRYLLNGGMGMLKGM